MLDAYCVECHGGSRPDGGLDLSGDKTRYFNMGYDNLVQLDLVDYTNMHTSSHDEGGPLGSGSLVSPLREYIETGKHYGVKLPQEARRRIYTWIDTNIPYYGTYVYLPCRENTLGDRDAWDAKNPTGWLNEQLAPVFRRRCLECHKRTVNVQDWNYAHTATVTSKRWPDRALSGHMQRGLRGATYLLGPEARINLTHPERSLLLTAPLAKEAGGFGFCKDVAERPVFANTDEPDYQAMLTAIRQGHSELCTHSRADMEPPPTRAVVTEGRSGSLGLQVQAVPKEVLQ